MNIAKKSSEAKKAYKSPEYYLRDGNQVFRTVVSNNGLNSRSDSNRIIAAEQFQQNRQQRLAAIYDQSFLRLADWPSFRRGGRLIRCADLFSGPGLMSLGVWEACRALGFEFEVAVAFERWDPAADVFEANFGSVCERGDIRKSLDGVLGRRPTKSEQALKKRVSTIDIAVGGPPCQGHSSLNNHTRRKDPRNALYDRMARFAEVIGPRYLIVENVSDVVRDKSHVVARTITALERLGYKVSQGTIDLSKFGIPQRRKRNFLVASLEKLWEFERLSAYERPPRSVRWAIEDLSKCKTNGGLHSDSIASEENQKRIEYLFRHKRYDLPDGLRPDCHRYKEHTYGSVYGRMHWDLPAQTITSGFTSMGQGRFVHPAARRTITPHEAARLQFIPDFFAFDPRMARTELSQVIGNAVPPKITYILALELLASQLS